MPWWDGAVHAWYVGPVTDVGAHVFAALGRLCEALADVTCERAGERVRITTGGSLPIAVEVSAARVRVALDGWWQEFAIDAGEADDDMAEADAALDLVGAALFGAVRVVVERRGGQAHRWTLELREGTEWTAVRACGRRSWRPFAGRSSEALVNACARPPGYAAVKLPAPASAPWLGLAGFAVSSASTAAVEVAIDGVLDLHSHSPKQIKALVEAYLEQCRARGIVEVRIIHGKGVGNLRRTVHALLERHPHVRGFRLGGHGEGSWGATLVDLAPRTEADEP
jgi:hypothetical protein